MGLLVFRGVSQLGKYILVETERVNSRIYENREFCKIWKFEHGLNQVMCVRVFVTNEKGKAQELIDGYKICILNKNIFISFDRESSGFIQVTFQASLEVDRPLQIVSIEKDTVTNY